MAQTDTPAATLPKTLTLEGRLIRKLRYGENPQQAPAGLYATDNDLLALHRFDIVHGNPGYVGPVAEHRFSPNANR